MKDIYFNICAYIYIVEYTYIYLYRRALHIINFSLVLKIIEYNKDLNMTHIHYPWIKWAKKMLAS